MFILVCYTTSFFHIRIVHENTFSQWISGCHTQQIVMNWTQTLSQQYWLHWSYLLLNICLHVTITQQKWASHTNKKCICFAVSSPVSYQGTSLYSGETWHYEWTHISTLDLLSDAQFISILIPPSTIFLAFQLVYLSRPKCPLIFHFIATYFTYLANSKDWPLGGHKVSHFLNILSLAFFKTFHYIFISKKKSWTLSHLCYMHF